MGRENRKRGDGKRDTGKSGGEVRDGQVDEHLKGNQNEFGTC
jgi:hypothetical protein